MTKKDRYIHNLEAEILRLRRLGSVTFCNKCKVSLPSIDKKICSCGLSDFKLKPGQKSVLENKVGV